jgi:hypothetical protein
VFFITNGRSSSEYSLNSVRGQKSIDFKLTIVRDEKHLDVYNKYLLSSDRDICIRVDDDFFLHPYSVLYFCKMYSEMEDQTRMKTSALVCKLWEPATNRIISSIKAYIPENIRKVGFRTDDRGKVDQLFGKDMRRAGFSYGGDKKSVLGIHAACPFSESYDYVKLRGEDYGKDWVNKKKLLLAHDKYFKKHDFKSQYKMRTKKLLDINKKSKFADFVRSVN